MSLRAYDTYRETNLSWLGAIPDTWQNKALKRAARLVTDRATETSWAIGLENIESWTGKLLATETTFESDGTAFRPGDVLYGKLRPYLAKTAVAHRPGGAVGDFHVLRPSPELTPLFLGYVLRTPAIVSVLNGSTFGARMPRVSWDSLGMLEIPFPTVPEQSAIVAFLDRETGKIDALVEAQRRLIDLLKEKRQTVISHAVTKGLDAMAPMKDSGSDWLGEMPAHWSPVPTRSLLARRRQLVGDRHADFELLSLTLGGIVLRDRDSGHGKFPAEFDTYQAVRKDDLVFCLFDMDETPRTVGLSDHAGMVTGAYDVFYGKTDEIAEFLFWLYLSRDFKKSLKPFYTGLRKVVRKETFGSIPVALPPPSERRAIVEYLRAATSRLDDLSAQAVQAISLLQERRAALVSAAVTGKIDLRGLTHLSAEPG